MVFPRKSGSALSLISEEHSRMMPSATKSCESLYSSASSCKGSSSANMLYSRKTPPVSGNAMRGGGRQATLISATTEVRQRVLSARRLRMKTFQNQLADAQQTIAELAHENRILRTLHKRQDSALAKYESTNAELPQLLHSHAEELRVWQSKYRNLQLQNKELEQKLKQRESNILSLSDQNKYFSQLNKDKNLEERQRLSEKLLNMETRLQEKDQDMKLLARKMQLEAKNLKQQILNEQKKTKDVMLKLEKARLELSGYRKLDELQMGEKLVNARRRPGSGGELKKDKELKPELLLQSATEDDTDVQLSQRSTHSHSTMLIGTVTTRTMRKAKALTPLQRRGPDRGGGDASAAIMPDLNDMNDTIITATTPKTIMSSCTTKLAKQESSLQYEDDCETVDSTDEADAKNNIDDQLSDDDGSEDPQNDSDYIEDVDEEQDDINDADDDDEELVSTPTKKDTAHMKADISNIRKQITDDYREREAFLDTFCRQATTGKAVVREGNMSPHLPAPMTAKRNGLNANIPNNRKNKLLAALKAIDDNKSFD